MKKHTCFSLNDFNRIYRNGFSRASKLMALRYFNRGDREPNKWTVVATKRIGLAAERNRAKRLIREAYRRNENKIATGYDIVIFSRKAILEKKFCDVEKALLSLFKEVGLLANKER